MEAELQIMFLLSIMLLLWADGREVEVFQRVIRSVMGYCLFVPKYLRAGDCQLHQQD
jgi:hypothetical protein